MLTVKPDAGGTDARESSGVERKGQMDGLYAKYVVFVLFLVNTANFTDRQLLSALAEAIKADLKISDADLGFLFGTAFAVFFSTFGLACGRLSDNWNRKRVISYAVGVWSVMTALSGTARSFTPLAAYRFGVGAGESCATPAAVSILCDYFSPKLRATVLAFFMSSLYIGGGVAVLFGGMVLTAWGKAWPDPSLAPFGLKAWQAPFLALGLPGLLLAFWVSTLREPARGSGDGIVDRQTSSPGREILMSFGSMLPVVNTLILFKLGGVRAAASNLIAATCIVLGTGALVAATGNALQWTAVGIGVYAGIGWMHILAWRDFVVFDQLFRCRTTVCLFIGTAGLVFMAYVLIFWCVPLMQRYYGANISQVTTVMGLGGPVCGLIGIVAGGIVADKLRARIPASKIYVVLVSLAIAVVAGLVLLTAHNITVAYGAILCVFLTTAMASGANTAVIMDMTLPRARSTATGFNMMSSSVLGISVMPYVIGYISDTVHAAGVGLGEALRQGMLIGMLMPIISVVALVIGTMSIGRDQANLIERARALGEPI